MSDTTKMLADALRRLERSYTRVVSSGRERIVEFAAHESAPNVEIMCLSCGKPATHDKRDGENYALCSCFAPEESAPKALPREPEKLIHAILMAEEAGMHWVPDGGDGGFGQFEDVTLDDVERLIELAHESAQLSADGSAGNMSVELLPCPFCGGPASWVSGGENCPGEIPQDPACESCDFRLYDSDAWNRRAPLSVSLAESDPYYQQRFDVQHGTRTRR